MSVARIQCKCGAYGYGSAIDVGFGQAEITSLPDYWFNDGMWCRHDEKKIQSVEIISGNEADQGYEMGGY